MHRSRSKAGSWQDAERERVLIDPVGITCRSESSRCTDQEVKLAPGKMRTIDFASNRACR